MLMGYGNYENMIFLKRIKELVREYTKKTFSYYSTFDGPGCGKFG
jgi:hypothetical protein